MREQERERESQTGVWGEREGRKISAEENPLHLIPLLAHPIF